MPKVESSKAMRPPLLFGWKINGPKNENLLDSVKLIESLGISFLVLDLNKLRDLKELNNSINNHTNGNFQHFEGLNLLKWFEPLGKSDLALPNELWSQRIVSFIKTNNFEMLKIQIEWSCYVSSRAVMIDFESVLSNSSHNSVCDGSELLDKLVNFCQIISSFLSQTNMPTFWISLDCSPESLGTWKMVYELCNFSERVKVCLKLNNLETDIEAWQSEPLNCVVLSENLFLKGDKITINRNVFNQLSVLMKWNVKIVIDGDLNYLNLVDSLEDVVMEDLDELNIKEVLKLVKRCYSKLGPLTVNELYGKGYEDLLQVPLQPLRDNLDSGTYSEFEKCSFKYNSYKLAILNFLKVKSLTSNLNVYVVGAGRGPLIDVLIDVFRQKGVEKYEIIALDKNPYTMLTLKHKKRMNGWNKVKLVCSDMRVMDKGFFNKDGKDYVNLVVSELLGPFGDNELSPECLYAFEKYFNSRANLTFIPQSYTSFAMPVQAPQIWSKIKNFGNFKNFHMPYTVNLKSFYSIGTEFLPCFTFEHPGKGSVEGLERYKKMTFLARNECQVHGFGAYFKCILFGGVELSILPGRNEDIKSWFPMFFPIEHPFPVKKSEQITLHVWRKCNQQKVWYEWAFTTPYTTPIHNVNGSSYSISKI